MKSNDAELLGYTFFVRKESKSYYYCWHSDYRGTYPFKILKKNCEIVND